MKSVAIILFCFMLVECNISTPKPPALKPKSVHIPDTTNNWYAKTFDYSNYISKTEITKKLNLTLLETDTSHSEIRIWTLGSNYDPKSVIILKQNDSGWLIKKLNYYQDPPKTITKANSIIMNRKMEKQISISDFQFLHTENLWQLPSQGEMKNGGKYGCVDGYSLVIEMSNKSNYKFLSYICPDLHVSEDTVFLKVVTFTQALDKLISNF